MRHILRGAMQTFRFACITALRLIVGGLIAVALILLWLVSPTIHVLEIENLTPGPLRAVHVRLAEIELDLGNVQPGECARRVVVRLRHSPAQFAIWEALPDGANMLGRVGYVTYSPSKSYVEVRATEPGSVAYRQESRLVGRPW